MTTIVDRLAAFALQSAFDTLPDVVVEESKRLVLDSVGCAIGATDHPKGAAGIDFGRLLGAGGTDAAILGTRHRSSVFGAAFANGELINALDYDAVLPPGHVVPYVLPGALAEAEARRSSGRRLIAAVAVAHEMSNRLGKAMDYHRTVTPEGEIVLSPVLGFSSTVFGATAAVGMLRGQDAETLASALALAPTIAPPNTMRTWLAHAPATTFKYLLAGALTQSALTAACMAELGHRGDRQVLDDAEFGYARFIATGRWEPSEILRDLGERWGFPAEQVYKPYPHCRVLHGLLDVTAKAVADNGIAAGEIESIRAWGEAWVEHPLWLNRDIGHVVDAQFSIAHGLALAAHGIAPGPRWQAPETVNDPSVLALMGRVAFEPHPEWASAYGRDHRVRPSRVEITARGRVFVEEGEIPKGTPTDDPSTAMSWQELAAKFETNAAGRLSPDQIADAIAVVAELDAADDPMPALIRAVTPA
ncbi:MmgE/PrpD family protein [Microbacterium sp. No. 7]|uniref:MmgE/PrpD family protein n=1 Tax=Microbacterium sp. No. 7 TaxID=1714373 RepID=UPI0006D1EEE8|nr:MmgE/PrpD family protein [Microbacterium sp. No. 7]ALJ18906.1 2-methylcitrate dehydratase [Microbacterium sp. No. 7]